AKTEQNREWKERSGQRSSAEPRAAFRTRLRDATRRAVRAAEAAGQTTAARRLLRRVRPHRATLAIRRSGYEWGFRLHRQSDSHTTVTTDCEYQPLRALTTVKQRPPLWSATIIELETR